MSISALDEVILLPVAAEEASPPTPFLVTGQERCGASVVQTALAAHPYAYCHGELLHPSDRERRRAHEAYFGPEADPASLPDYCAQVQPDRARANPERYLHGRVFPSALCGERALGVKLPYPHIRRSDLWEYLEEAAREGLAAVHVARNPLACFVSARQAEQTRVLGWRAGEPEPRRRPVAVHLDVDEFVAYARLHEADARRVDRLCPDAVRVRYADLVQRPDAALARVFAFLELPACRAARPAYRRLPNRDLRRRVANFEQARARVPAGMRHYFEADLV